jgi:RNA polymerase sigma factor (TIGR02999 family)
MPDITRLLQSASDGEPGAKDELFKAVYTELEQLARTRLSRDSTLTHLDARSLVHEAYLRLTRQAQLPTSSRKAFFAYASSVMRSVVVDYVRQRATAKRGSGESPVTLVTREVDDATPATDVSALDEALEDLKRVDERCHRLVEMRFFGGLEFTEIADVLGISVTTVSRDWSKARLFLFKAIHG